MPPTQPKPVYTVVSLLVGSQSLSRLVR